MTFNLTSTGYENLNPMMLHQYVTVDQCKDYVASTTRNNYILMGLLLLVGIAMLIWVNRDKIKFFRKFEQQKEMLKLMKNPEALEKLGEQFGGFIKGNKISIPEVKENGRRNVSENNDSRTDNNSDSNIHIVQDDEHDESSPK